MRALTITAFGGPEVLRVVDAPVPEPGPGQIRVAVHACGVNPFDWKQRRGLFGGRPPIRVGVEIAGVIDAIGAAPGPDEERDVAAPRVGERVFGFAEGGGAADFTLSRAWAPIPVELDFVAAAAVPVAVESAYRVLDLVAVDAGMIVVVNGASGVVGQAMTQLALARGARVVGTASVDNHPMLARFGAQPITYGADLADRVHDLHLPRVDIAIDAAGGALPALVALTGDPRRVVTIVPDPDAEALGVRMSGGNSAVYALRDIAALLTDGRYRPPDTTTYSLDDAARAQQQSETGHLGGRKLVLAVRDRKRTV